MGLRGLTVASSWLVSVTLTVAARSAANEPAAADCDHAAVRFKNVQTQPDLDKLLDEIDKAPSQYEKCPEIAQLRQLARIRTGRNELVSIRRSVEHATTEAELAKWRDLANRRNEQMDDGYIQLVGGSKGGTLELPCTGPSADEKGRKEINSAADPKAQEGRISEPKYSLSKEELIRLATKATDKAPVEFGAEDIQEARAQTCEGRVVYESIQSEARWRRLAASNLCGGFDVDGQVRKVCLTYGVFASAISAITFLDGAPNGMKGGRLLSVLVPYAGVRIVPWYRIPYLSIDLIIYSAYITSGTIDNKPASTSCGGGTNELLKTLPCEVNPTIRPYAAVLAGITLGKENVGYLTLAPATFGWAAVGSQGTHPYFGLLAGTLQLTGRF